MLDEAWESSQMLFDFSEAERNTIRHALEIYVSDLREEIVKDRTARVARGPALREADPRRRARAAECVAAVGYSSPFGADSQ